MDLHPDLDFARAFHGHLGPNLVIGMRMGKYAIDALGARRYFGLEADVTCAAGPPGSCIIDGVQLGSGCTMGKANIVHTPGNGPATVVFTNTEANRWITLTVADGLIEQAMRWMRELGEEEASRRVWEMKDDEIFTVIPG